MAGRVHPSLFHLVRGVARRVHEDVLANRVEPSSVEDRHQVLVGEHTGCRHVRGPRLRERRERAVPSECRNAVGGAARIRGDEDLARERGTDRRERLGPRSDSTGRRGDHDCDRLRRPRPPAHRRTLQCPLWVVTLLSANSQQNWRDRGKILRNVARVTWWDGRGGGHRTRDATPEQRPPSRV